MSLNGEVHMSMEACTIIKVTGELKALHWRKSCDRIIWKEFFSHNWAAEEKVTRHALKNCGRKLNNVVRIIRITSSFFSSTNGELSEIDKNIRKVWEIEDVSNMMGGKWKKYEEEYVLNEAVSKLTERIDGMGQGMKLKFLEKQIQEIAP